MLYFEDTKTERKHNSWIENTADDYNTNISQTVICSKE